MANMASPYPGLVKRSISELEAALGGAARNLIDLTGRMVGLQDDEPLGAAVLHDPRCQPSGNDQGILASPDNPCGSWGPGLDKRHKTQSTEDPRSTHIET